MGKLTACFQHQQTTTVLVSSGQQIQYIRFKDIAQLGGHNVLTGLAILHFHVVEVLELQSGRAEISKEEEHIETTPRNSPAGAHSRDSSGKDAGTSSCTHHRVASSDISQPV